jgi:esterase
MISSVARCSLNKTNAWQAKNNPISEKTFRAGRGGRLQFDEIHQNCRLFRQLLSASSYFRPVELNYKSFGQGEPVIILHGLFGTLDNWQTIAKALADDYLVFIVDQRNHGRSPHLDDMSYPLLAEDLRDFMESHWMFRAHIIGHSMGGKTAMQFALHYPDMVDKLAVIDMAPKTYPGGHETIIQALLDLDIDRVENRQDAEAFLARRIETPAVLQFLLKNITRNHGGRYSWKMNLPAIHRNYAAILQAVEADTPYDGPALFLRGSRSDYVLPQDEPGIKSLFPKARIETVEDAGHWVHAEAPDLVIEKLRGFLKE